VSALADALEVFVEDRPTWRTWLEANHARSTGAWLVTWRSRSGKQGLPYEEAVEEALCFGWVDGTGGTVDEDRGKLYFAPRKPTSGWAATNKARVERLIADGRMTPAGLAAIERRRTAHGSCSTASNGWRCRRTSMPRSGPSRPPPRTSRRSHRRHGSRRSPRS